MKGIPSPETISPKLERIAKLAKEAPDMVFTSLAHHIDSDWMLEAYRRTRKDGAVGIDERTAEDFEKDLWGNLWSLVDEAKSGRYVAPPVRRVHIPKGGGSETRPIGIPTFADKVLQRAIAMLLEAVYEQDFMQCSYGFRPGRSAHQALEDFRNQMMSTWGGWVVEIDIRKFFDSLDHRHLQAILRQRVRDGVVLRLIGKWLNAGVMEDGGVSHPASGTPQGGVISPLLANIYLHAVLDTWFERDVRPHLKGRATLVRYADDAVLGFACEGDARRVMAVLSKRFGKYGLALHPEKTRLVPFVSPAKKIAGKAAEPPCSFDLLGFTHFWGRSRKGHWVIRQKTAKDRLRRALQAVKSYCQRARHRPLTEQHRALSQKLRGHYSYYGITGNGVMLGRFRDAVLRLWRRALARRSAKGMSWTRFDAVHKRFWLPRATIVHTAIWHGANP